MERLEHQRVEKEIKAQQIQEVSKISTAVILKYLDVHFWTHFVIQARRKRQEMLDKQRVEETLRKNKVKKLSIFMANAYLTIFTIMIFCIGARNEENASSIIERAGEVLP